MFCQLICKCMSQKEGDYFVKSQHSWSTRSQWRRLYFNNIVRFTQIYTYMRAWGTKELFLNGIPPVFVQKLIHHLVLYLLMFWFSSLAKFLSRTMHNHYIHINNGNYYILFFNQMKASLRSYAVGLYCYFFL